MPKVVIFAGFNGTVISTLKTQLTPAPFYLSVCNAENPQAVFEKSFGKYNESFDYSKDIINTLMRPDTVKFFHAMLADPDVKINIISKTKKKYIKALFLYQGFTEAEIKRLSFSKPEKNAESIQKLVTTDTKRVVILDTNADNRQTMQQSVSEKKPGVEIIAPAEKAGEFKWSEYQAALSYISTATEKIAELKDLNIGALKVKAISSVNELVALQNDPNQQRILREQCENQFQQSTESEEKMRLFVSNLIIQIEVKKEQQEKEKRVQAEIKKQELIELLAIKQDEATHPQRVKLLKKGKKIIEKLVTLEDPEARDYLRESHLATLRSLGNIKDLENHVETLKETLRLKIIVASRKQNIDSLREKKEELGSQQAKPKDIASQEAKKKEMDALRTQGKQLIRELFIYEQDEYKGNFIQIQTGILNKMQTLDTLTAHVTSLESALETAKKEAPPKPKKSWFENVSSMFSSSAETAQPAQTESKSVAKSAGKPNSTGNAK
ncbi:MAG TPA: hypothetical protein VLI69_03080 [Gammaproteobacteria bacterium]|nr:hypothetical protein [Gammaproteobacteria bacterium]